jgi:predicted phage tail protein
MNVLKSGGGGNSLSGLKDLLAAVSDPNALKKAIMELEEKAAKAEAAEAKLFARQSVVEKMEVDILPKAKVLEEKERTLEKLFVELDSEKAKWRARYAEIIKREKELTENEAKNEAEGKNCAEACKAKEEVAKSVLAEAMQNRAEARALLDKMKNVYEQFKAIAGAL